MTHYESAPRVDGATNHLASAARTSQVEAVLTLTLTLTLSLTLTLPLTLTLTLTLTPTLTLTRWRHQSSSGTRSLVNVPSRTT